MKVSSLLSRIFAIIFVSGFSASSFAQWELDSSRSLVEFITTKNASVAEIHQFNSHCTGGNRPSPCL